MVRDRVDDLDERLGRDRELGTAERCNLDLPRVARQLIDAYVRVTVGEQRQSRQRADAEARRDEGLRRDVVIGRERDGGREARRGTGCDEMRPATRATRDPSLIAIGTKIMTRATPTLASGCYGIDRLVEQRTDRDVSCARNGLPAVAEHEREVDVPLPQPLQSLGWLSLLEGDVHIGVGSREVGGDRRDECRERGREGRHPEPAGAQPGVGRDFRICRVDPAEYLFGPLRQQPSGVGEPDSAPDARSQRYAHLGLEAGELLADGRLGVAEHVGGGGQRTLLSESGNDTKSGQIHRVIISLINEFRQITYWTYGSRNGSVIDMTVTAPTMTDIRRAERRLWPLLPPTPMWSYPTLDSVVGASVLVKHENVQPTGAFKVRGGLNLLATMPDDERERGIVAYSTGNHGQSLAYAAQRFGVACTIVVPRDANPVKVRAIRSRGANLVSHGLDFEEASAHAAELAQHHGYRLVGAADEPALVAGVGSLYTEMFAEAPDLDALFVPVGGGSGAAAACIVAAAIAPRCEVIAVQSSASRGGHDSWRQGRCVARPNRSSIEGVATGSGFELTQQVLRKHLADFVLVGDDEVRAAQLVMLGEAHTLAEGAGAVSLAGALAYTDRMRGKSIGVVCTGGNASESELRSILTLAS